MHDYCRPSVSEQVTLDTTENLSPELVSPRCEVQGSIALRSGLIHYPRMFLDRPLAKLGKLKQASGGLYSLVDAQQTTAMRLRMS